MAACRQRRLPLGMTSRIVAGHQDLCRSAGGAFAGGAFAAGITCGMPGLWWLCLVSTDRSMHAPDAAEAEVRDSGRLCRRWRRRGGCCAGETTKAISCSTRWVRCCRFKPCVGGLGNGSEASVGADVSGCATAAALPRHICVCRACHHHVMPHIPPPTHTRPGRQPAGKPRLPLAPLVRRRGTSASGCEVPSPAFLCMASMPESCLPTIASRCSTVCDNPQRAVRFTVREWTHLRDKLPLRQQGEPEPSPFNPPWLPSQQ